MDKRYAKKENALLLYSEKPFKQAAIIFYFIGTLNHHAMSLMTPIPWWWQCIFYINVTPVFLFLIQLQV